MNQNSQSVGNSSQSHPGVLDSLRRLKAKMDGEELQQAEKIDVSEIKEKQIQQLLFLFKKNGVIKNEATIHFVEEMLIELPVSLVDSIYDMYSEAELIKLRKKN